MWFVVYIDALSVPMKSNAFFCIYEHIENNVVNFFFVETCFLGWGQRNNNQRKKLKRHLICEEQCIKVELLIK